MSLQQLKNFRQWESSTPGHPEAFQTPGVEATTGPLGQGTAIAVGMAMAERKLANLYNRPGFEMIDHFTYALVSDGDLMEGISAEAGSLAGHLKLGKLIYLYDSNHVTLDGPADLSFSPDEIGERYAGYGWQVLEVKKGDDDLASLHAAIAEAQSDTTRPSIIIVTTTIGFGSPKAGTSSVHGSPLGKENVELTKKNLGWKQTESFFVPHEVAEDYSALAKNGARQEAEWKALFQKYESSHPELASQLKTSLSDELPRSWNQGVPVFKAGEEIATRKASEKVLNSIAKGIPWLIGGDADLSCSTSTSIAGGGSFDGVTGSGRNIHYGVREHAMAALANGMCFHGGLRPFVATFFAFSDYMRPSIRLAALDSINPIYVWTHDSIGLGEDGPTHQPIEQLMSLRAMPNMTMIRPCDANETAEAWKAAILHTTGPVGLVLTRQNLRTLDRSTFGSAEGVHQGAYILSPSKKPTPDCILIASGSEVALALEAQQALAAKNVDARVVSMPCWEFFEKQSEQYREKILPKEVRSRVSIEAGTSFGWHKWIGEKGKAISIDRFGASAPGEENFKRFGFTVEKIVDAVLSG